MNIWDEGALESALTRLSVSDSKSGKPGVQESDGRGSGDRKQSTTEERPGKPSRLTSFRKSVGIMSGKEREVVKTGKMVDKSNGIRQQILTEEEGRWPDEQWRNIVAIYHDKVGMTGTIAHLRQNKPIQYLHLLRAGYFEPIPVAWATQASNPLKFSIEAGAGWRGITPAWRGYEDTAEERLYWVLNHRAGSQGTRLKPDFISAMNMALARMATAVEPPPEYYSATDTCHVQHTSTGYSKQVLPPPFVSYDRPAIATDDTMILLDVSGSMDFEPLRPVYNQYLITNYTRSTQPKNKGKSPPFSPKPTKRPPTFSSDPPLTCFSCRRRQSRDPPLSPTPCPTTTTNFPATT